MSEQDNEKNTNHSDYEKIFRLGSGGVVEGYGDGNPGWWVGGGGGVEKYLEIHSPENTNIFLMYATFTLKHQVCKVYYGQKGQCFSFPF